MRKRLFIAGVITIPGLLALVASDGRFHMLGGGQSSTPHALVPPRVEAVVSSPTDQLAYAQDATSYFPVPDSKGGWRRLVSTNKTATEEEAAAIRKTVGLEWSQLGEAWNYVESFGRRQALLVIRHGWVAGDWDNVGVGPINSATKSLVGLAIAKAFELSDAGSLVKTIGPDSYAYRYLPVFWGYTDSRKRLIKIKHLTTMTAGLQKRRDNWPLGASVAHAPETHHEYSSEAIALAAMVLERAVGQRFGDFVIERIAKPIGVQSMWFWPDRTAASAAGGAFLSPADFARIGYLVLRNGTWDHGDGLRQVIDGSHVRTVSQRPSFLDGVTEGPGEPGIDFSPDEPDRRFLVTSGTWWVNRASNAPASAAPVWPSVPDDAFGMHGYGKAFCLIIPSLDMIIVHQTAQGETEAIVSAHPEFLSTLMSIMMRAVSDPSAAVS